MPKAVHACQPDRLLEQNQPGFSYPKSHHLLDKKQFDSVFKNARRIGSSHLTLLYIENRSGHPRLGFVISKKNAKLAVARNKIKRVIRESFRINQNKLGAYDIVILGRKGVAKLSKSELRLLIDQQWSRLPGKSE